VLAQAKPGPRTRFRGPFFLLPKVGTFFVTILAFAGGILLSVSITLRLVGIIAAFGGGFLFIF
jgi:hypothetical protein